jgi:hypothetical protein
MPKKAKVRNAGVCWLGHEVVGIVHHLQPADVHTVELYLHLAIDLNLLLHWQLIELHPGVARTLDIQIMDDLGYALEEPFTPNSSSAHHELHGGAVPHVVGGVTPDSLDCGLEVGVEFLGGLPLNLEGAPPQEKSDLRLLRQGHTTLVQDDVDLALLPLIIGVGGVPVEGVDQEVRRLGALLLTWFDPGWGTLLQFLIFLVLNLQ